MTRRKKIWIAASAGTAIAVVSGLAIAASILSRRFEPFIREQAIAYLSQRFQSDVQLEGLKIRVPKASPLKLIRSKGAGTSVRVEGSGIALRRRAFQDVEPVLSIGRFSFEVDLGTLWERKPIVRSVVLDRMSIRVPPKGERRLTAEAAAPQAPATGGQSAPQVRIEDVLIRETVLTVLPKDPTRNPLVFAIRQLQLKSAGPVGTAMTYEAALRNPKPPGEIVSRGRFGPWVADDPAQTFLAGDYTFENADLGVFNGIAGILRSTGSFEGSLSAINAKGEATVPDFRLKMAGNRVPLKAQFEVLVDGTNGNTVLKPVRATLGSTWFTTSGGIIKHEGDRRRSINLNVNMPKGNMRDLLRLTSKQPPMLEGVVALKTKIGIPPLSGKVRERLTLDGEFHLSNGHFLRANIQEQLDNLSRRGQGQPKNKEINEVFSGMSGRFKLSNEILTFEKLTFAVPGADVALAGDANLDADTIDFRGTLKLQARVSQTMTGWKRWALKPVDPFFAKEGAGTFLRVKVDGTFKEPKFGLDRRKKEEAEEVRTRTQEPASYRKTPTVR